MNTTTPALQLYTVREHTADLDALFAHIARLGITDVEPFSILDRTTEVVGALARHGLRAPTGHAPFLSDEMPYGGAIVPLPPAEVSFEAARALGIQTLFDPMVPADRWRRAEDIAHTAERLNRAVVEAAAWGLRVGYHNHSFEFHHDVDGRTGYEYFVSLLDPAVVLEVDVYWAAVAGQDVPGLLRRLGDRVAALHLKDGPIDADPFAAVEDGSAPRHRPQQPLGQGSLDIAAILAAAPASRHDVVEFDHVESDVFEAVSDSLRYLAARNDG